MSSPVVVLLQYVTSFYALVALASLVSGAVGIVRIVAKRGVWLFCTSIAIGPVAVVLSVCAFSYAYELAF